MNKLRTLLLCDRLYYLILLLAFALLIFASSTYKQSIEYIEKIDDIFEIKEVIKKDYGYYFLLKGKEKIIGYYYTKDINDFLLGDKVKITGEIKEITNSTVPNTFNYKEYLKSIGIANAVTIDKITKIKSSNNIFYKIKNFIYQRIKKAPKSLPYIHSLLFGNSYEIDEDIKESYQINGIIHLFSISGLHISLFSMLIVKILKLFKVKETNRCLTIMLFLLFYMFLTNYNMAMMRGSIFTILLNINKLFYFHIKKENLLLLTLSLILFLNPFNIYQVSLQFSFMIPFWLMLFGDLINKEKGIIKKLFVTSVLSFLVSYPIAMSHFYEVNLASILYNIIYIPYVSFILVPGSIIVYIFPIFDKVFYLLILIMEQSSKFLETINLFKYIGSLMPIYLIIIYYIVLFYILKGLKKKKYKRFFLLFLVFIMHFCLPYFSSDYYLTIDVGQGDSTLISIGNKVMLIDTGGLVFTDKEYSYNIAKNKILPYLKSMGIREITNILLTHGDADHIRESIYIINNFKVKNVYFNDNDINTLEKEIITICQKKKINIKFLKQNDEVCLSNNCFKNLNSKRSNENDSSIVLYGKVEKYSILLMGDISKDIEKDILKKYKLKDIYLLKLAHHGSKTSSDSYFLKEINPSYAIISAGKNNHYNHPSKETIEVLNDLNIPYLETSKVGSIKFIFKNGTFKKYLP